MPDAVTPNAGSLDSTESVQGAVACVGQTAPDFALEFVISGVDQVQLVRRQEFAGRWLILLFYPRDFSFVCPTELTAFSARLEDFQQRDCEILGISSDSVEMHREWLNTPPADGGLGPLRFPLGADVTGQVARQYGVWDAKNQVALRGLFIIDPEGTLQYTVVQNLSVGRNTDETLRVLDAVQAGGLCPAGWTSADGQFDAEALLRPGTALGHYRIRSQLGSGSFGNVFEAWDTRLERVVALKVLHSQGIDARSEAILEARSAARLNHPNVCTIYAVDEVDGMPIITMERLHGVPLADLLGNGPLERHRFLRLATGMASGILAAHQQGVLHGDLKPANIVITDDGQPKILDFGLARSNRQPVTESVKKTQTHPVAASANPDNTMIMVAGDQAEAATISGTPAYMSPEQASGQTAGPAADVFALGLIFFEMITGRRAMPDKSPLSILLKLRQENLAASLLGDIPVEWQSLIVPMLAPDQADRSTMTQVLQQLQEAEAAY
ncbi:protein kinase domain-containing protein [Planctomicrobium sp. SH527]|uniref:protein kinase domain-containing protein n=1 Tax=Planctomicrobium sp. SH527 TaxID=3448123 RepID=UPI003F5B314A